MTKQADHLRVLIANQLSDRLELLAEVVTGLGHEVVGQEIDVEKVGALTAQTRPDVAIVGLGESSTHALELLSAIVREAFCPVIAVLHTYDSAWLKLASERGLYAYLIDQDPAELQSALDITLSRYAEYQAVQGAFAVRQQEVARNEEVALAKKRQALELHDDVVQGLAVAHLALKLGREEESEAALKDTLERARNIVTRELAELEADGQPLDQLIGDAAHVAH